MTSATDPQGSGTAVAGEPDFLTMPEVAAKLRIKPWTATLLCRDGELPATKPGKQWLVRPADLDAYIDAGRNVPAPDAMSA